MSSQQSSNASKKVDENKDKQSSTTGKDEAATKDKKLDITS